MKKVVLLFSLIYFSFQGYSQQPVYSWARSFGSTGFDVVSSMAIDKSGNTYTMGRFWGTVDFDPGTDSFKMTAANSLIDIFIQKLDSKGDFVWAARIGGDDQDFPEQICVDDSGYVYASGYFSNMANFDPAGSIGGKRFSTGRFDAFILKLTGNGKYVWAMAFGGKGSDFITDLKTDGTGNIFASGYYEPNADIQGGPYDAFIRKWDKNGNAIWMRNFTENGKQINSIALDPSGSIVATGIYYIGFDADPGTGESLLFSEGNSDIFVLKLNPLGNFVWARSFGGTDFDYGNYLGTDASGNIYTTGSFRETADMNPGSDQYKIKSNGERDAFIQKLDGAGNFLWARAMGGTFWEEGSHISIDKNKNVYSTGYFESNTDFDPGAGYLKIDCKGLQDIYVQSLDSAGNFRWAESIGSKGWEWTGQVLSDGGGNVFVAGSLADTSDLDPQKTIHKIVSQGDKDIFVQKLYECYPTSSQSNKIVCNSYTWNGVVLDKTGVYYHYRVNKGGCDSTLSLVLTVIQKDISVTVNGSELKANKAGATYQWLECDQNFKPISGATGQSYKVTKTGNYAVIISNGACQDTSACYFISTSGSSIINNPVVTLYPNPAYERIILSGLQNFKNVGFKIYDLKGAEHEVVRGENNSLLTDHLSKGMYCLLINEGPGISIRYFVIE